MQDAQLKQERNWNTQKVIEQTGKDPAFGNPAGRLYSYTQQVLPRGDEARDVSCEPTYDPVARVGGLSYDLRMAQAVRLALSLAMNKLPQKLVNFKARLGSAT